MLMNATVRCIVGVHNRNIRGLRLPTMSLLDLSNQSVFNGFGLETRMNQIRGTARLALGLDHADRAGAFRLDQDNANVTA